MTIHFGREICGDLSSAESREWLVTNGIGGYASGTIAGLLTRRYHGMLIAALNPPVRRTLLVTQLAETLEYDSDYFPLHTNRWSNERVDPAGYIHIEHFSLDGTIPTWVYACADVRLEKRVWMEPGANTTYVSYTLTRSPQPVTLYVKVLTNYRDHHSSTQVGFWKMAIEAATHGVKVTAFPKAQPVYVQAAGAEVYLCNDWYQDFDLAQEHYRGLPAHEDHLHAADLALPLTPGQTVTVVASTDPKATLDGTAAIATRQAYDQQLRDRWHRTPHSATAPDWITRLALAADQFVVTRSLPEEPNGHSIIAGYPWFNDWGRDTMISLSGLTLYTGRSDITATILRTYARYLDQGMLPNVFPDAGKKPGYNTVDAVLWYLEAIRAYYAETQDLALIRTLFPLLQSIIDWHLKGTRYQIQVDPDDGLLYAGEPGSQLTWMDAKIGKWVVTPRVGKPVEINALWYNALGVMAHLATALGESADTYQTLAAQTRTGFQRFWNPDYGYCYDVVDPPDMEEHDASLRPNQLLAIAYPHPSLTLPPLLSDEQQKAVVNVCSRKLLTSHGLRSLSPDDDRYCGHYGGGPRDRDAVYHQGTVWGWLLGPFVQAHLQVYRDPAQALAHLSPMADHLRSQCIGSLGEIFDGDPPMTPRGAIAQAWTVAQIIEAWVAIARVQTP
jgi:predicted glycogen debranching enzyme